MQVCTCVQACLRAFVRSCVRGAFVLARGHACVCGNLSGNLELVIYKDVCFSNKELLTELLTELLAELMAELMAEMLTELLVELQAELLAELLAAAN